jgi:hypothetical protein
LRGQAPGRHGSPVLDDPLARKQVKHALDNVWVDAQKLSPAGALRLECAQNRLLGFSWIANSFGTVATKRGGHSCSIELAHPFVNRLLRDSNFHLVGKGVVHKAINKSVTLYVSCFRHYETLLVDLCFSMDPILEFFLDGVCPETIEDYAHYLSYIPEFAQRCNWKRLNDLVFLLRQPS